jgi:hypothetical protein
LSGGNTPSFVAINGAANINATIGTERGGFSSSGVSKRDLVPGSSDEQGEPNLENNIHHVLTGVTVL